MTVEIKIGWLLDSSACLSLAVVCQPNKKEPVLGTIKQRNDSKSRSPRKLNERDGLKFLFLRKDQLSKFHILDS